MDQVIEHSENEIITQSGLFENEIRPGVLQCGVNKPMCNYVSFLSSFYELFAECMFLERWTGASQVQPRFRNM